MEDTGELVHLLHSDLHRPLHYEEDGDGGSDLDRVGVRNRRCDLEDEVGSDLDFGGAHKRRIALDGEEETESDLDQTASRHVVPGKKSGKMGIVRRKGVSKSKGSPYRSSGSSHEEDLSPLVSCQKNLELGKNGEFFAP